MNPTDLPQVSLQRYVDLVRRRRWQLVPISLLGLLVGGLVAFFIPRYYVSEQLLVHQAVPGEDPLGDDPFKVIVDSAKVSIPLSARKAAELLQWPDALDGDAHQRAQYDKELIKNIDVIDVNREQKRPYAHIHVRYRDRDGKRAAAFLNTLTQTWIKDRIEQLRKPAIERRNKAKIAADSWNKTYEALAEDKQLLERRYGIEPDVELSVQRGQYTARQKEAAELRNKLLDAGAAVTLLQREVAELETKLAVMPARVPPAVEQLAEQVKGSPEAMLLFQRIALKRLEIGGLVPGTAYHRHEVRNLEFMERTLREMLAPGGQSADGTVPNPAYAATQELLNQKRTALAVATSTAARLQTATEEETTRLQHLIAGWTEYEQKRDKLEEAKKKREAANADRDAAESLLARLDSEPPVAPVADATVPPRPTEPNILLVALIGSVLGLAAAIGLILLLDVLQGTFKTVEDVERGLPVPVLGGMSHLETDEERAAALRLRRRNSLIALSLLALVGVVLVIFFVDPTRLPGFVRDLLAFLVGRS